MKLTRVRLQNFKSIVDTGIVEIEAGVTVVIGKNEQGKTTFLKALASWNPKTNYSPTDLPNHLRDELEGRKGSAIPIVTLWLTATPSEIHKAGITDSGKYKEFKCIRFFDGHREYFGVTKDDKEEKLTFAPPDFGIQTEKIKAAANALKMKLQAHSTRYPEFATHLL